MMFAGPMDHPLGDETRIATHAAPISRANFLIHVDLSDHGMPGKTEQLWAWQLSPTEFEVASLPFFPYGIALGDRVQTHQNGQAGYVVERVISRSGRRLLRVGITDPELHELLHRELARSGLKFEWHGADYAAVDLPDIASGKELLDYLEPLAGRDRIVFEVI